MKKDFISIADFSPEAIQSILDLAMELKKERQEKGENKPILKGQSSGNDLPETQPADPCQL